MIAIPATSMPLVLSALVAVAAASLVLAVAWPRIAGRDALARRMSDVSHRFASPSDKDGGLAPGSRSQQKRSVRETLLEVEEIRKARSRRVLIRRLREAGLDWSKRRFYAVSLALAVAGLGLALAMGGNALALVGFPVALGTGVPQLMLTGRRRRRVKAMALDFPNAVDIVIRGVKSGLPLPDCLRIVAHEARQPLKTEFGKIIDDLQIGLSMPEAVQRFAERVPMNEANFFAIVIAVQSRTGGNLSESLQNLSNVLRERQKMAGKIQAVSSEAKASAMIIGALPVVVTGIVYLTSPDYISVLFTTTTGNMVLLGSAVWMATGALVMRNMINFDF